jgi:hypothetical protein
MNAEPKPKRSRRAKSVYEMLVRVAALVVALASGSVARAQSLTPGKAAYAPNEPIVLEFKAFPGNAQDWITVVPSNAATDTWGEWFYTQGKQAGSFTFKGLPAGVYQARGYFDWPKGGTQVRAQTTIQVGAAASPVVTPSATPSPGPVALTPNKLAYDFDESIRITFRGFSGSAKDWITVVPITTPTDQYAEWYYTEGKSSGELSFRGLPAGDYEARAYFDWPNGQYVVKARTAFKVRGDVKTPGAWLRARKPVYLTDEDIEVTFGGFGAPGADWITIVEASSPTNTYAEWHYTEGTDGSLRFEGLMPGSYQVRAYFDWPKGGYDVRATYALKVVDSRKKSKRVGICAKPKARQAMDRWLATAVPADAAAGAQRGLRYDAWGRVEVPKRKLPPVHRGKGRCEMLWKDAARLQSKNMGTLKEYVEKHQ